MTKKFISIVTPTYNEELNIELLCHEIKKKMLNYPDLNYEHIVIDNDSIDQTQKILRNLAKDDKKIKLIFNRRNFGWVRSFYHGLLQANGDAVIMLASDFQDPLELIDGYIKKWKQGSDIVLSKKISSEENLSMRSLRNLFYKFIAKISDTQLTINTTGYGLFSKIVVLELKKIQDPYPYFRGLITELGFRIDFVEFHQPLRKKGISKMKFNDLYDIAILGIIKHSKIPLRFISMLGFLLSAVSLLVALIYLSAKLFFWNSFEAGIAPLVIGLFSFASLQIFLLGLIGEYVGTILTQSRNIPHVFEKERINF
jgi:glycosyltransferase involved in cell wall biosynthesis